MGELKEYSYRGPFKKAVDIAEFYGFKVLKPIPEPVKRSSGRGKKQKSESNLFVPAYEHEHLSEYLYQKEAIPSKKPLFLMRTKRQGKSKTGTLFLHVFSCPNSIAEALLFQTTRSILNEYGHGAIHLDINSLGDMDSFNVFFREFKDHYKKHLPAVGPCCRNVYKDDIFQMFECGTEDCQKIRIAGPKSISYLSEKSRTHFKQILEHLEALEFQYRINHDLVGESETPSRVLFKIHPLDNEGNIVENSIIARGARYQSFLRKERNKARATVLSVSIDLSLRPGKEVYKQKQKTNVKFPHVYFVQLGTDARLKGLNILEILRDKKISVRQSITEDSLGNQLEEAERLSVPYTFILGVKEVKDGTVIIRDMKKRSQEIIDLSLLPKYVRKIVK